MFRKCAVGVLVLLAWPILSRADDIADAKAAFQTLVEYQKTDDARSPELFADDCVVKSILTDGTQTKELALSSEQFRDWLQKALALKQGNNDVYEKVEFEQAGANVKMTSTVLYSKTGLRGPLSILYVRDARGALKIKELTATMPVPPEK